MTKHNFCRAELLERINFTDELALYRFRTDIPLTFKPGQYATIAVEQANELIQRPYSIASSPYEPTLEFFIELVPDGGLTPRLWDLKIKDKVLIRNRTAGRFTLLESDKLISHLMLATVTGIAPYISIIRTQRLDVERGRGRPNRFAVIHGGSYSCELGVYKDELAELARAGWLNYIPTISRPWGDVAWNGETGRVEDVIRKHADQLGFDYTNSIAYACGHPQMIENARAILTRARFPSENIREEKYFIA